MQSNYPYHNIYRPLIYYSTTQLLYEYICIILIRYFFRSISNKNKLIFYTDIQFKNNQYLTKRGTKKFNLYYENMSFLTEMQKQN